MKTFTTGLLIASVSFSVFAKEPLTIEEHVLKYLPVADQAHDNGKYIAGDISENFILNIENNFKRKYSNEEVTCELKLSSWNGEVALGPDSKTNKHIVFTDTNSFQGLRNGVMENYFTIVGYTYEKNVLEMNRIAYLSCMKKNSYLVPKDIIELLSKDFDLEKLN